MASYGPYYTSELRAIRGQKKALTGQEAFSPWEMESIVRGELGSRYAAAQSRQSEQRNYELAVAANQRAETQLGMQRQANRQAERSAEMAGIGQAIQWGGMLTGEWGPTVGTGTTTGITGYSSQQAAATGRTGAFTPGQTTGLTTQGTMNTLGSGLTLVGMASGNPAVSMVGLGIRLASPIISPVINSIYQSLTATGGLFGSSVGASSYGPSGTLGEGALFGGAPTGPSLGEGALFGEGTDLTFGASPSLDINYGEITGLSFDSSIDMSGGGGGAGAGK